MNWARFHPLTRITIVVAIAVGLAMWGGVERVGEALAGIASGGSFAERCAQLPAPLVQVIATPPTVIEDRAQPLARLTAMSAGPSLAHRTVGLTQAKFGHSSAIDVSGIEDRNRLRACATPKVSVDLFLRPMIVYVASEYASDPCRTRTIREHEQRHVDVYTRYAAEASADLAQRLRSTIGSTPHFAPTMSEAHAEINRRIEATLEAFIRDSGSTLEARQALVDTPEEYERVSAACR